MRGLLRFKMVSMAALTKLQQRQFTMLIVIHDFLIKGTLHQQHGFWGGLRTKQCYICTKCASGLNQ